MIHCKGDARSMAIESILNCLLRAGPPMRHALSLLCYLNYILNCLLRAGTKDKESLPLPLRLPCMVANQ